MGFDTLSGIDSYIKIALSPFSIRATAEHKNVLYETNSLLQEQTLFLKGMKKKKANRNLQKLPDCNKKKNQSYVGSRS